MAVGGTLKGSQKSTFDPHQGLCLNLGVVELNIGVVELNMSATSASSDHILKLSGFRPQKPSGLISLEATKLSIERRLEPQFYPAISKKLIKLLNKSIISSILIQMSLCEG